MKILAIDSSAKTASAAVLDGKKILGEIYIDVGLTHSQTLLLLVERILANVALDIDDIDAFAVTTGPGSFTGVRIGVALVKGFAFAKNKPCIPVSTLHALAYNLIDSNCIVCAVMDARCNQVYNAIFEVSSKSTDCALEGKNNCSMSAEASDTVSQKAILADATDVCCPQIFSKFAHECDFDSQKTHCENGIQCDSQKMAQCSKSDSLISTGMQIGNVCGDESYDASLCGLVENCYQRSVIFNENNTVGIGKQSESVRPQNAETMGNLCVDDAQKTEYQTNAVPTIDWANLSESLSDNVFEFMKQDVAFGSIKPGENNTDGIGKQSESVRPQNAGTMGNSCVDDAPKTEHQTNAVPTIDWADLSESLSDNVFEFMKQDVAFGSIKTGKNNTDSIGMVNFKSTEPLGSDEFQKDLERTKEKNTTDSAVPMLTRLTEDRAISIEDLLMELEKYGKKKIIFVGDGAELFRGKIAGNMCLSSGANRLQTAKSVACLGQWLFKQGAFVTPDKLMPSYLRLPQAQRILKEKQEARKFL